MAITRPDYRYPSNLSFMRCLLPIATLLFIGGYCSSCKKGSETIVKTDTVRVRDTTIVRDTVYSKLIRTDEYRGYGEIDCPGGCLEYDFTASTDVSFFSNDSTSFVVRIGSQASSKKVFNFSIVRGAYKGKDANLFSFEFKGADSLKYYGSEPQHGLGTMSFLFRGRLQ